jgi:NAD(P)-dependent dehydrogenase (short-subunit alcohol dehydrogenase family)
MSYDFTSKVALITGAGSGIGRATAQKLASLGCSLCLSDINGAGLAETLNLCKVHCHEYMTEVSDVSDTKACTDFVDNAASFFGGRLDFVFNCAGVNPTGIDIEDTTDEYFDKLVSTNLKGTFAITRAAVPHLEKQPGSSIVNVSSIMGVSVSARISVYCMTKFGVNGFTKAMALELGPKGVRINAVAPGYIDTPSNAGVVAGGDAVKRQEEKSGMGRMGTAEEVADVVAFLFRFVSSSSLWLVLSCGNAIADLKVSVSDEAKYVNGSIFEVTGGRA